MLVDVMNNVERSPNPRLLILETSGRVGQVAVARGCELGPVRELSESRRHARDLTPTIVELCNASGWKVRELDAVIVSTGPGSYTGLRIGIMSAKTLAYASGCAVLGISTFAAIALRAPQGAMEFDVIADAQQQHVYVQRWRRPIEGGQEGPLTIRSVKDWLDTLAPGIWVSGPGLRLHEKAIPPVNPLVAEELRESNSRSLLELGMRRWLRGEADDLWALEPLYLRPSSAEEKWDQRAQRPPSE
jgi:tRNA threonylcarbamoyladenosine biosynthesis protein TsaB